MSLAAGIDPRNYRISSKGAPLLLIMYEVILTYLLLMFLR